MFKNPKEVRYRVGEGFANLEPGTIINAILLLKDHDHGLIFHPWVRGECPSLEVALLDGNIWVSLTHLNSIDGAFVNATGSYNKFQHTLLGKRFKFSRKVYN